MSSCGKKRARIPPPPPPPAGTTETGIASWYGHPYHGRYTASGEIYDMHQLTAAHRTLPFGTWVRVTNLSNGRSVDVRITDRGPFVRGRSIDLSLAAARAIELVGPGTARVTVEVQAPPPPPELLAGATSPTDFFAVQIGAFQNLTAAEQLRDTLERRYGAARLILRDGDPALWRVVVGRLSTEAEAAGLAAQLSAEHAGAFVVRVSEPETNQTWLHDPEPADTHPERSGRAGDRAAGGESPGGTAAGRRNRPPHSEPQSSASTGGAGARPQGTSTTGS